MTRALIGDGHCHANKAANVYCVSDATILRIWAIIWRGNTFSTVTNMLYRYCHD